MTKRYHGHGPRVLGVASSSLRRHFHMLVRSVLATGASGAAVACGSDGAMPGRPPFQGSTGVVCERHEGIQFLRGLELTRDPPYLGLYEEWRAIPFDIDPATVAEPTTSYERDSIGRACASASDAQCAEQLEELTRPGDACRQLGGDCAAFLIERAEDGNLRRLQLPQDRQSVLDLLGSIDSGSEAILMARLSGQHISCPDTPLGAEEGSPSLEGTRVRPVAGGFEVRTEWENCGVALRRDLTFVAEDGEVHELSMDVIGESNCIVGRRPEGLVAAVPRCVRTPLGAYFAHAARLEAASVHAFVRMARELIELGAPASLVAAAGAAAHDELRHARIMLALARRFGAEPTRVTIGPRRDRPLEAIALDNAVEGCTREAFGALLATYQAGAAVDPSLRPMLARIALDETRHAALSLRLAAWLQPRLSAGAREMLADARQDALRQLAGELELGLPAADARRIGWPDRPTARQLLSAFAAA